MPKRVSDKVDPKILFQRGESFWNLTSFLSSLPNEVSMQMAFAFITAHAFACEAFFKVITQLERGLQPLETHNLRHLFNDVSPETQERVRRTWEERHLEGVSGKKMKGPVPSWWNPPQSFDVALDRCAKAFVDWRYTTGTDDKPLYFHLIGLSTVLREIILEKKPEFRSRMSMRLFDPETHFVKPENDGPGESAGFGNILNRKPSTINVEIRRSSDPKDSGSR